MPLVGRCATAAQLPAARLKILEGSGLLALAARVPICGKGTSNPDANMTLSRASAFALNFGGAEKSDARTRWAAIDRIDRLATLFDVAFLIPGTKVRFGVEALLRLVPGIGDAAASALSLYLIYEAYKLEVPLTLLARMLANVVLEAAVGTVPVAGDAFDVLFRANRRNVALLRQHFARGG
jgi:hypothetical protein